MIDQDKEANKLLSMTQEKSEDTLFDYLPFLADTPHSGKFEGEKCDSKSRYEIHSVKKNFEFLSKRFL